MICWPGPLGCYQGSLPIHLEVIIEIYIARDVNIGINNGLAAAHTQPQKNGAKSQLRARMGSGCAQRLGPRQYHVVYPPVLTSTESALCTLSTCASVEAAYNSSTHSTVSGSHVLSTCVTAAVSAVTAWENFVRGNTRISKQHSFVVF